MTNSRLQSAAARPEQTDTVGAPLLPERARHLPIDAKSAIVRELSSALDAAIHAQAGIAQADLAAALDITPARISRCCNRSEDEHALSAQHAIMLCHSRDARLRAVGLEYLRAVVALAGIGEIDESRHAAGETLHRLALVERESSEAKLALIEGASDGHEDRADLARLEREAQQAADAWQAEANRARAARLAAGR